MGLGSQITVKLARLDKSDSRGTQCFAINTDDQVGLELPSIMTGTEMLLCKWILHCKSRSCLSFSRSVKHSVSGFLLIDDHKRRETTR